METPAPNAWLPRPLRTFAGRALERALERAFALDPDSARRLAALEGRSIRLDLDGPALALTLTVTDGRLRVGPPRADSTLRVAATPGSLLAMALRRGGEHLAPGRVAIAGDAELARQLERLAARFAPDVEEAFAQTFGDVLGVPLWRALRDALAHVRESAAHLAEDGADWLRDEARLAVPRGELEDFLDGVDDLRERAERLESRLARLDARVRERRG
ncbi:ubiquinone biosynthesis accessory factor UbiJ [Aerosticca soli]|jgi:ubiquinone biosynthesis protein UbiJ|uniref:Ubiquinone biosynthesis accessory factor UbiJ n=1 Tax=Aerosticca soli TaxID=2010829 RepID=A0A2Z6E7F7_9GAMM|nr:SCP2 sterol-binding domain-containing protein [Aerosticca soli]MDI3262913.1 SCP2 sterol-binding domain-containing protein [Fulvimonas sp.]BBD80977.1 protein YigP clustered with ubiquinone biosynthetic genes [Aerosticca soli]